MQLNNSTALAELHGLLGLKDTIELLEVALPLIAQRSEELHQHLSSQDWDAAAKIAHRMLSSANLYSSKDFIKHLKLIHEKNIDVISTRAFQQLLQDEFNSVHRSVAAWLDEKRPH